MRDLRPDELNYVSGGDYGQKNTNLTIHQFLVMMG